MVKSCPLHQQRAFLFEISLAFGRRQGGKSRYVGEDKTAKGIAAIREK